MFTYLAQKMKNEKLGDESDVVSIFKPREQGLVWFGFLLHKSGL